jgi:hypothetical protein
MSGLPQTPDVATAYELFGSGSDSEGLAERMAVRLSSQKLT